LNRILIISSENTGHGHKSITQSIQEQITKLAPRIEIETIDGFSLGGKPLYILGKMYNPIAVHLPALWKLCYWFGNRVPSFINFLTERRSKQNLLKCIERVRPDLILSVHPGFVGSVLDILEEEKLTIPLIPLIADLDNVSMLWADERAECIICPTEEARNSMLDAGIPSCKLKVIGFPSRERFCTALPPKPAYCDDNAQKKVSFLLMSGSQGSSQVIMITRTLMKSLNCRVTIMAGNNRALKAVLEKALHPLYGDDIEVVGFTEAVESYMLQSDILIIRASPNVLIESVNLCRPVIIIGALTGQEEKNPEYAVKYNLGVVCKNAGKLPDTIQQLLADNGKKLMEIYNSQVSYRKPNAAKEIAEFCIESVDRTYKLEVIKLADTRQTVLY
jgi:processive 1,2-diacylglycerol beta-glucosyltransferase